MRIFIRKIITGFGGELMVISLQSYIIIIGFLLEILGVLYTLSNHFSMRMYNDSGPWYGPNDNKILNDYRNKIFGKTGTFIIVIGVIIQLSTMLYVEFVILTKATALNIIMLTATPLILLLIGHLICKRTIHSKIYTYKYQYVRNNLIKLSTTTSRLHYLDGMRYINYLVDEVYEFEGIDKLMINIERYYDFKEIYNFEIFGNE